MGFPVFISWSKSTSKQVALALKDWLPNVLQNVDPFISSEDIQKGSRWGDAISRSLESTSYGIVCLTQENLAEPWILFEAGALSKQIQDSRVMTLLVGLQATDISPPLSQFQSTNLDADDFLKLLSEINKNSGAPLSQDRLQQVFTKWWPDLEAKFQGALQAATGSTPQKKVPSHDPLAIILRNLDELVQVVRSTQSLIGDPARILPPEYLEQLVARVEMARKSRGPSAIPRGAWEHLDKQLDSLRELVDSDTSPLPLEAQTKITAAIAEIKDVASFIKTRLRVD